MEVLSVALERHSFYFYVKAYAILTYSFAKEPPPLFLSVNNIY